MGKNDNWVEIDSSYLVSLSRYHKEIWLSLKGTYVIHSVFGKGKIVDIYGYAYDDAARRYLLFGHFVSEYLKNFHLSVEFQVETIKLSGTAFANSIDKLIIQKNTLSSIENISKSNENIRFKKEKKKEDIVEWCNKIKKLGPLIYPQFKWPAEKAYDKLCDSDVRISKIWCNSEKNDNYTMARMLSARAAEKVAIDFYELLNYRVTDVSIMQLEQKPGQSLDDNNVDWKLYDLLLNDEVCIDVKNARFPVSSNSAYTEHCISQFKKNRSGDNVIISGVVSPYLKLENIKNPQSISESLSIKFIGETTLAEINNLEKIFSSGILKVNIGAKTFIPRWMFDFPKIFYKPRQELSQRLKSLSGENLPSLDQCIKNGLNPLPIFLLSGLDLPDGWTSSLKDWQVSLYERLRPLNNNFVSLPHLFLTLLTHFLEILTDNKKWQGYNPCLYRQILYTHGYPYGYPPIHRNLQMPLGILDPLGTIDTFIETLTILWTNKKEVALDDFEFFKFNGIGLLEGKKHNQENFNTILAYCGGFIDGMGKCGRSPLIIGSVENCPECGRLICDICGYCSNGRFCTLCDSRMEIIRKSPDFFDRIKLNYRKSSTENFPNEYFNLDAPPVYDEPCSDD